MEFGVEFGLRIVSDPHIEVFWFNYPLFFRRAPELQFIRAQLEMERLLRTCSEVHPLKSLQLADGARRASGLLMNVELYDLVSSAAAGVGHIHGNIQAGSYFRLCLAQLQIVERKIRVAESVAEGVERSAQDVPVARLEFGSIFRIVSARVVVVERECSGTARPAHGKVSSGIGVAEENVGDAVAGLTARIPGFQNRWDVLGSPRNIEWTAVDQNEHNWL